MQLLELLSNIDLFFAHPGNISEENILLEKDEARHLITVMRAQIGSKVFVTDGAGNLFITKIISFNKNEVHLKIDEQKFFANVFENIFFCIPHLKKQDRLEYMIEKLIELGASQIIIFNSDATLKRDLKTERIERLIVPAMKQSLHLHKAKIEYSTLREITSLKGERIVFAQDAQQSFLNYNFENLSRGKKYFIVGPEGDFSTNEKNKFADEEKYFLTKSRLRSETAALAAASIIFARPIT